MAKVKSASPSFEKRLIHAIKRGLTTAGIKAQVDTKAIPGTKLRRVYVIAPEFEMLGHSERQDLVWRIVTLAFSPDDQLKISMILTLSPTELKGD